MIKTYEMSILGYENTFPVMIGEKKEYVSFKKATDEEGEGYLHTDRKDIQMAIEKSDRFLSGEIELIATIGEDETDAASETMQLKTYDDVNDFQTARDILLGDPYNMKPQAVTNNPDSILKAASKVGVSFPKLSA